jgi:hypothetical protein
MTATMMPTCCSAMSATSVELRDCVQRMLDLLNDEVDRRRLSIALRLQIEEVEILLGTCSRLARAA